MRLRLGAPPDLLVSRVDVSLDGQRFLLLGDATTRLRRSLVVVLNWTEGLNRLVPTGD